MLLSSSTIANNVSTGGAAIYIAGSPMVVPMLTLRNATVSGNRSGQVGASGIEVAGGSANIDNSTIAFNLGGGLQLSGPGSAVIRSSIVDDNCPAYSATCFDIGVPNDGSKSITGSNNLVGSVSAASSLQFLQGEARLAPLGWHGGSVPTHALMALSAAIDTGSNPVPLASDARGQGFGRTVAFGTDIGAYERQQSDDEIFAGGFYYFAEFPGD
jgi:hypothetical protein